MSKTVTIRLEDNIYDIFKKIAQEENRTLPNLIETAAMRYLEEIQKNRILNESIKSGILDIQMNQGRYV